MIGLIQDYQWKVEVECYYQLDFEIAFADQKDVFHIMEDLMIAVFKKYKSVHLDRISNFQNITFKQAMEDYGTDKPDLRNPLKIIEISEIFENSGLKIFESIIKKKGAVRAIKVEQIEECNRALLDKLNNWAREELKMPGLGYIVCNDKNPGPIAKNMSKKNLKQLYDKLNIKQNDVVFIIANEVEKSKHLSGKVRQKLGETFNLIDKNAYVFCWVTDFPFYKLDERGKLQFFHNPFSMPNNFNSKKPLEITAKQYDIVCNGIELSSGAVRNHDLELFYQVFELVGHTKEQVNKKFKGIVEAFSFGVPPHAGCAPGIERLLMILCDEENLRDVVAFPLNQSGEDHLMGAPNIVDVETLLDLGIKILNNKG